MRKSKAAAILAALGIMAGLIVAGHNAWSAEAKQESPAKVPYYFIAIHNEPRVEDAYYQTLRDLIDHANKYNIRLNFDVHPSMGRLPSKRPAKIG